MLRTLFLWALAAPMLAAPTTTNDYAISVHGHDNHRKLSYSIGGWCLVGSNHCRRSWGWFSKCTCDAGWEGACCDRPTTCTHGMDALCPRDMLVLKNMSTVAFGDKKTTPMRIGTAPLPEQLRGVYWLSDQGDSSSLVSFAQSRDGLDVSPGEIPSDAKYKVRVTGDRTWSFADESFNWEASQIMDLIYEFEFDSATNPRTARVYAGGGKAASIIWTGVTYAVEFAMELRSEPHTRYPNSVVWDRPSRVFGNEVSSYEVIQVMNEDGEKLEPAFSDWVKYNDNKALTGNTPGKIFYFEAQ